jgi:hypothetical protein
LGACFFTVSDTVCFPFSPITFRGREIFVRKEFVEIFSEQQEPVHKDLQNNSHKFLFKAVIQELFKNHILIIVSIVNNTGQTIIAN